MTAAAPRGPDAEAVSLAELALTPAELVALTAHEDPILARAALEALRGHLPVRVRLAALAGAPTHDRPALDGDQGRRRVLGPIAMEVRGG